eukprot:11627940-Ditylum_brightwellii.AAC.1
MVKKSLGFNISSSAGVVSHALYNPRWFPLGDVDVLSGHILKPSSMLLAVITVSISGGSLPRLSTTSSHTAIVRKVASTRVFSGSSCNFSAHIGCIHRHNLVSSG